jgi:hypothetical protein
MPPTALHQEENGVIKCCVCQCVIGHDPRVVGVSHGYCTTHYQQALAQVDEAIARWNGQKPTPPIKRQHPRPAGMSYACDNFLPNLDYQPGSDLPLLLHCPNPASYRMVIQASDDCYAVKRCRFCAGDLRSKAFAGDTFEILEDEPIGEVPYDGRPYYSRQPVIDESETYF